MKTGHFTMQNAAFGNMKCGILDCEMRHFIKTTRSDGLTNTIFTFVNLCFAVF